MTGGHVAAVGSRHSDTAETAEASTRAGVYRCWQRSGPEEP